MTNPTTARHAAPRHRRAVDRTRSEYQTAVADWNGYAAAARRRERAIRTARLDRAVVAVQTAVEVMA